MVDQQRCRGDATAPAAICDVRRSTVGDLGLPPDVRAHLGPDHRAVCAVSVRHEGRRYTLVVDAAWLEFAAETQAFDPGAIADMTLPRAAIKAVIENDADDRPTLAAGAASVWWSDDGIPHLSAA